MKKCFLVAVVVICSTVLATIIASDSYAEDLHVGPMAGFMMSPMTNRVTVKPGETYTGSFWIMNPEENTASIKYNLAVKSFYRDDDSKAIFEDVEGRGQMAKWITLDVPDVNTLAPRESSEVKYTINIPYNAPSGGQYAAITATSATADSGGADSAALKESIVMAHTIFAEISGQINRNSEIVDLESPTFLFDGNIVAKSKVTNTGNIHGTATYTLEVYSLFSDQPIFSNVSDPEKKLILPDRTLVHETTFENTPAVGVFNINYKVEFEGGNVKELKKMVIKCPIWIVFIILTVIVGFIIFIIIKIKTRSKRNKEAPTSEE